MALLCSSTWLNCSLKWSAQWVQEQSFQSSSSATALASVGSHRGLLPTVAQDVHGGVWLPQPRVEPDCAATVRVKGDEPQHQRPH
eukprot:2714693-Amphidinium_carterae.1